MLHLAILAKCIAIAIATFGGKSVAIHFFQVNIAILFATLHSPLP